MSRQLTFMTMTFADQSPQLASVKAVDDRYPMFGTLQGTLQRWLVDSLIPDSISRQVLG